MENITKLIIIIALIIGLVSYALIQSDTKFTINIGEKNETKKVICQDNVVLIENKTTNIKRCDNGTTTIISGSKINVTVR